MTTKSHTANWWTSKRLRRVRPRNADSLVPIDLLISTFISYLPVKHSGPDRDVWRERFMACYRRGRLDQMNGHIPVNSGGGGDGE